MNDRDHFAAAALTGLLGGRLGPYSGSENVSYATLAYKLADAMLSERDKASAQTTDDRGSVTPKSYVESDEKRGDCPTKRDTTEPRNGALGEPVAWALQHENGDLRIGLYFEPDRAYEYAHACGDTVVPLYRHPPCQVFLQKNLTLTDEEREAMEWAIDALVGIEDFSPGAVSADASAAATLRKLLERLA